MKKALLVLLLLAASSAAARGQARSTASRAGDLQIGGGFTSGNPDYPDTHIVSCPGGNVANHCYYANNRINGFAFYSDFDFRPHWGVEVDFHQINDRSGTEIYERTYEIGGRYMIHRFGIFRPYVKGLYGRGVYNFPAPKGQPHANLAYNMFVGGGGIDIAVHPRVNVRLDYEYQHWMSFPAQGLNPQLLTIGAAYHFGPGKPH